MKQIAKAFVAAKRAFSPALKDKQTRTSAPNTLT